MYRSQNAALMIATTVLGGVLLIIGVVALARAGFPGSGLTGATAEVGPFTRTPLTALIEIGVGAVIVIASATAEKGSLLVVGVLSLVFGVVWLIEPGAFSGPLGVGRDSAALYLVVGVVSAAAGVTEFRGGTVVRERRIR